MSIRGPIVLERFELGKSSSRRCEDADVSERQIFIVRYGNSQEVGVVLGGMVMVRSYHTLRIT